MSEFKAHSSLGQMKSSKKVACKYHRQNSRNEEIEKGIDITSSNMDTEQKVQWMNETNTEGTSAEQQTNIVPLERESNRLIGTLDEPVNREPEDSATRGRRKSLFMKRCLAALVLCLMLLLGMVIGFVAAFSVPDTQVGT